MSVFVRQRRSDRFHALIQFEQFLRDGKNIFD